MLFILKLIGLLILITAIISTPTNAQKEKEEKMVDISSVGINGFEPGKKNATSFCGDRYCPTPYRCWVAAGYNKPSFCFHPSFNPTEDNKKEESYGWLYALGGGASWVAMFGLAAYGLYSIYAWRKEMREIREKLEKLPDAVLRAQAKQVQILEQSLNLPFFLQDREDVEANRDPIPHKGLAAYRNPLFSLSSTSSSVAGNPRSDYAVPIHRQQQRQGGDLGLPPPPAQQQQRQAEDLGHPPPPPAQQHRQQNLSIASPLSRANSIRSRRGSALGQEHMQMMALLSAYEIGKDYGGGGLAGQGGSGQRGAQDADGLYTIPLGNNDEEDNDFAE